MVCPAETPEGGSCGLVKNLTLLIKSTEDICSDKKSLQTYSFSKKKNGPLLDLFTQPYFNKSSV